MDISGQKVQESVSLLQRRFPDWQSFSNPPDPKFHQEEINYKQKLSAEARSLLAPEVFEQVFQQSDDDEAYETLVGQIEAVGQSANLLYLSTPAKGDLNILYDQKLDKPTFCRAFYDLLYGAGTSDERLGRYLTYVKEHELPNKWTFPTYYLFLCNPDEDIFIKPDSTRNFFNFIGAKGLYKSTPTAERYTAFKAVFHDLASALSDYAPRDMIDIHSLVWVVANNIPNYWKIAPGEGAWQWEDCRNQGFIAIGWDELGDIANLNRKEFDARRDQVKEQHPDRKNRGMNQVWQFAQIEEGDRIVANRGQSEVVGIGTVTGPYYYQSDAEQYRHRLPVEWNDPTPRNIKHLGFKWVPTLIGLSAQEFDAIAQAPKIEQDAATQAPQTSNEPMSVNPDCPFNLTTFELLAKLHHTPKKTVYDAHKQDFERYLTTPFKGLMKGVATHLPASIADLMETKVYLFGHILKADYGKGGANEHYWGAFYPKGSKKTQDAQLLLVIGHSSLTFGFDIGHHDYQRRERFRQNCQKYHQQLIDLLEPALNNNHLRFGHQDKLTFDENGIAPNLAGPAYEEWLKNGASSGVHVNITLSKGKVLASSQEDLIQTILQTYQQLFPLVLLAVEDDPLPAILEYLDQEPEPEPNPPYPLSQCAQETYLDESLLNDWIHAIHRKGQAVLYGPPGTGKTYLARRLAKHLISEKDGFVELVQFHPAYTYEDFMQGIRPQRTDDGLDYPTVSGRFLDFCKRARGCQDTCVLIIDEINRANLAQVFGELMYLLEYREDQVALAGGKPFSIPKNVRIIGTMNTADRSIALVDHALRRRFAFLPLYPDMNILKQYHAGSNFPIEKLIELIEDVNQEINDPQYSIGTSFFLDQALATNLKAIWCMEIEPYLQEYFFDQTDKVEEFQWDKISHRVMPS